MPITRYRFTVEDYHRMAEAGILGPQVRVELIEGEIVEMPPIGSRHAACVNRLTRLFITRAGSRSLLSPQNPVQLPPDSEPQPDIAVLSPRDDDYASALPGAGDTLLIVEVSDTSLPDDRGRKLPLYARHGIPEVWLVDLQAEAVEVYRSPVEDAYQHHTIHQRDDTLEPAALPGLTVPVDEILP